MSTLEGKVVVVTGAASGIGLAICRLAGDRGALVVAADVESAALERVGAMLPPTAVTVETDVSDPGSVRALHDQVLATHGRVDVLCNNAGVSTFNLLADQTLDDWRWVLDVNLWGVVNGITTFLPTLRAQGTPAHIVNTASVAGLLSGVAFLGPYAASKVAVVSISETLRIQLAGSPINVSVVCPASTNTGVMDSERNRPARFGTEARTADGEAWRLGIKESLTGPTGQEPDAVAAQVVGALFTDRFWIVTHPDMNPMIEQRCAEVLAALPEASGDR